MGNLPRVHLVWKQASFSLWAVICAFIYFWHDCFHSFVILIDYKRHQDKDSNLPFFIATYTELYRSDISAHAWHSINTDLLKDHDLKKIDGDGNIW